VSLPVADLFNGTTGTTLAAYSGSWGGGTSDFTIQSNGLAAAGATSSTNVSAFWAADVFPADQWAEAPLLAIAAVLNARIGVGVRIATDGTANEYGFEYDDDAGETYVFVRVGGTWTQLASFVGQRSVNDILRLEAKGNGLEYFVGGISRGTLTDATFSTGAAGVVGRGLTPGHSIDSLSAGGFTTTGTKTIIVDGILVPTLAAQLKQGATVIASRQLQVGTSFSTVAIELTQAEHDAITDWSDLRLTLQGLNGVDTVVSQVFVRAPAGNAAVTKTVTVSGTLRKSLSKTVAASTTIRRVGITKGVATSATLRATATKQVAVSCILLGSAGTKAVAVSATLQKIGITKTVSVTSLIQKRAITKTVSVGALLVQSVEKTVGTSAVLRKTVSKTVITTAALQKTVSKNVTIGSVLRATLTRSVGVAATIRKAGVLKSVSVSATIAWLGQTARPFDDITVGGWTNQSGSNTADALSLATDEADVNDADYIESVSTGSDDICEIKLGPLSPPNTGTVSLWTRIRSLAGTGVTSNEPSGMTLISSRPFNALYTEGWDEPTNEQPESNVTILNDATAPKSPNNSLRFIYAAGSSGGGAPWDADSPAFTYKTVYVRQWTRVSANWQGHPGSAINKMYYLYTTTDVPSIVIVLNGANADPLVPFIEGQNITSGGQGSADPQNPDWGPNLGVPAAQTRVTRGEWFNIEVVAQMNTANNADGFIDLWLNGTKITHVPNVNFQSSSPSWRSLHHAPVWGGGGGIVTNTMYMDWDHLYVSGKN